MANSKTQPSTVQPRFAFLFQHINAAGLGVFRILLGTLLLFDCWRWWAELDLVFIKPRCNIPLDPFGLISPLSAEVMQFEILLMGIASVLLLVGLFVKPACLVHAVLYGHFVFAEKLNFNNHYYLVWILLIVFSFIDSTARYSAENVLLNRQPRTIPLWQTGLIKMQMIILYFFGGIAKLNPDWLQGQPMTMLLQTAWGTDSVLSPYAPAIGLLMSWFGLIFDLIVGFALLHPVGRWLILPFLLGFHLSNKLIFGIGIFPFFCLATFVLYPTGRQIEWALDRLKLQRKPDQNLSEHSAGPYRPGLVWGLGAYLLFHLLMPFRHYLIEGNYHWTREQYYFAWTMKLDSRSNFMAVEVYDPEARVAYLADPLRDLFEIPFDPLGVWDYAHFLETEARERGLKNPQVYVLYFSTLNGRPLQLFLNPDLPVNLQPRPEFTHAGWVVPLKESDTIGKLLPNQQLNQFAQQLLTQTILKKEAFRRAQGVDTSGYFQQ